MEDVYVIVALCGMGASHRLSRGVDEEAYPASAILGIL